MILLGKILAFFLNIFNIGSGSTWPGHIALNLDKNFLKKIQKKNPHLKIILVVGTNGKTTTVSMIKFLLEKFGKKVFSNPEGANLLNGIASAFIKNSNFLGNIKKEYAVFEVDEFYFPKVLENINPETIIILNLFRDQLDRYGEVNTIGLRWFESLKKINPNVNLIINGDDPFLYYTSKNLLLKNLYFFGIEKRLMRQKNLSNDVDFSYCPKCGSLLKYQAISYSHLGDFYCQKCGFKKGDKINDYQNKKINYRLMGLYNVYNTNAVLVYLEKILKLDLNLINSYLKNFSPAFGRQEEIIYHNKKIRLFLVKNPAGFNQAIKAVFKKTNKKISAIILLNNRVPDGHDVSWIWDVDFELIKNQVKKVIVGGDRLFDMVLRLKYAGIKNIDYQEKLKEIVKKIDDDQFFIFANYSAMLEIRKILVGRKFL